MSISLASYKKDKTFYRRKAFLVTVKSFDLQSIRKRYIKSKESKTGRVGSVERREVAEGGLVYMELEAGKIIKNELLGHLPEPRGLDISNDRIAVSSENLIHIFSEDSITQIKDPWFSYIHTVKFNKDAGADKILVSSSGYDCIFEYDLARNTRSWEWFAWENGFKKGFDPETGGDILLTRSAEEATFFRVTGKHHLFIKNPQEQSLPTANRAAFINSVLYDTAMDGKLLATFFHEGAVYRIDMASGATEKILDGMKSPHGGRNFRDQYMATSTATGEVVFSDSERITFKDLPGKPTELESMEWLQNSAPFDDCIITIDANRNSFVLFDPEKKEYDMIAFDPNWAIQDIAEMKEGSFDLIKKIRASL